MPFKQALNTSALVWRNGQVDTIQLDAHEAMLRALVTFLADKAALSVSYAGTGTGTINYLDGGVGAPSETWTITLTGGGTTFTVSGSVSLAQASGTVGVNYTTTGSTLTSLLSFVIEDPGSNFINGDIFTVTATVNGIAPADVWVLDAWNNFDLFTDQIDGALWWHGEGDGTQAIYAGIRLDDNPGDQAWNWAHRCSTGYSGSQTWSVQPGVSLEYFSSFFNSDMLYWFIGNGRRYCVSAKVGSTFHAMYQGLFLPFGSPTEFPLPICNIGEEDARTSHTNTNANFNSFCFADFSGQVRNVAGAWMIIRKSSSGAGIIQLWPNTTSYGAFNVWDNHENFDSGDNQLFPIVLVEGPTGGTGAPLTTTTFGVLDGVRRVTGFGAVSETVLTIGGNDHVMFHNIFRVDREDFWAMEMA